MARTGSFHYYGGVASPPKPAAFLFFLFLSFFSLIISACATPPSLTADFLAGFVPEWRELTEGVDVLAGSSASPKLRFWALRVDTANPAVNIVIYPGADNAALSLYVSSFVERADCAASVNTSPFSPSSAKEGEARAIIGLTISGGVLISPPVSAYDALVFYKDGRMAVENQGCVTDISAVQNAAGGFHALLRGSGLTDRARSVTARHPRTAAGIDGQTLYLLVIDGRQAASVGATEGETAFILQKLGATDGINFDGGGSSAMAIQENRAATLLNTPSNGFTLAKERAVAACLGIRVPD
jgi:exopolysaccharide biosynthesis protein